MKEAYILKKDLPDFKAGTYLYLDKDNDYYWFKHENANLTRCWHKTVVENTPSWFEKIIDNVDDAAALIKKYRNDHTMTDHRIASMLGFGNPKWLSYESYIKSNGPDVAIPRNLNIPQPESVEEKAYAQNPVMERNEKKFSKIGDDYWKEYESPVTKYSLKDMEECFNISRFDYTGSRWPDKQYKFKSFTEYMQSKK